MSKRDTARYMFAALGARWSLVLLGGIGVVWLMYVGKIAENAGVPLLAAVIAGAGLTAIGSTPPPASDSHEIEPVANQRIAATLDPREPEPPAAKGGRAVPTGWKG